MRERSGGFDMRAAAVRLPAIGRPSQAARICPAEPPRGVPVSNPPRLRDFAGFLRPRVLAFRASRSAPEASCAGAERERSCAVRVGGAAPRGRLDTVQEVLKEPMSEPCPTPTDG